MEMKVKNTSKMLLLFFLVCLTQSNTQRLVYNKSYCNENQFPIKLQSVLPQFPAYSMSISSSTYQAGKSISIEVKGCKDNGFRAFLLRASVQGYFLAPNKSFKNTNLGTITVSCGVKKQENSHVVYSNQSPNNIMRFRWEPPFATNGNITFHFTAVPKIPTVFWLTFGKSYKQGDENQIIVEQRCATSTAAMLKLTFSTAIIAILGYQWT